MQLEESKAAIEDVVRSGEAGLCQNRRKTPALAA
jgi:hypothetical protein